MPECWICKQKAEWKLEKYNEAKNQAIKIAIENDKTTAIWKKECTWDYGSADTIPDGATAIEYISQHR